MSRVCHLLDTDHNLDGRYFWSIVRDHDRGRFPISFCIFGWPGEVRQRLAEAGVDQFALRTRSRAGYPVAVVRLARILRRERIGLLHGHFFDPTFVGLLAARLARVPFVFTRHHSDHHTRINRPLHVQVDAWCGRLADRVIAVSEATKAVMVGVEGVPPGRITVVHNGFEPLAPPSDDERQALRRELGLDGSPVILVLARLHEEKGHRFLFEALSAVNERVGKVRVLLGGDGPHRSRLEALARHLGIEGQVSFLGRRPDVAALLGVSSLLVLPSLAESFGFVLVEAMSLGVPVVATTSGGIPEVVEDGVSGLLVPVADAGALADAISLVLQDRGLAERLGAAGPLRARSFSFLKMMRGYERVYGEVLGRPGGDR